jgi:hypothetical protein
MLNFASVFAYLRIISPINPAVFRKIIVEKFIDKMITNNCVPSMRLNNWRNDKTTRENGE